MHPKESFSDEGVDFYFQAVDSAALSACNVGKDRLDLLLRESEVTSLGFGKVPLEPLEGHSGSRGSGPRE